MNKTLRDLLILAGGFGAIWLAFVLVPWEMEEPGLDISIEKEMELGDLMIEDWIFESGEMDVVSNPTLDSAMEIISNRLLEQLDSSEFNHHIWVVDVDEINAFTLPGGYVIVNQGLIKFSEHPEEVAGVIAHELGHVALGHSRRRMIDFLGQNAMRAALGMILSRFIPGFGIYIANALTTLLSARMSRGDEYEADEYAAALLTKAGIGTTPQKSLFQKLEQLTAANAGTMPAWFLSHPKTEERIAAIEKLERDWHR